MHEERRQRGEDAAAAGGAAEYPGEVVESLVIHCRSLLSTYANAGGLVR
jgi:hypothetical protein